MAELIIGTPQPTANHNTDPYHHNGQQTANDVFKGGEGSFKVKDVSDLAHPGPDTQFVVDRILMKKHANPTACQNPSDGDGTAPTSVDS